MRTRHYDIAWGQQAFGGWIAAWVWLMVTAAVANPTIITALPIMRFVVAVMLLIALVIGLYAGFCTYMRFRHD